jgi:hypothetical protein
MDEVYGRRLELEREIFPVGNPPRFPGVNGIGQGVRVVHGVAQPVIVITAETCQAGAAVVQELSAPSELVHVVRQGPFMTGTG